MDVTNRDDVAAFITVDSSQVREIMNPRNSAVRNQSLAEATLPVGAATTEHYHVRAEEIYYILQGHGASIANFMLPATRNGNCVTGSNRALRAIQPH